jgi:biotin operon repressor
MSIQMLSQVWKDKLVTNLADRFVLVAIADSHNPQIGCFPSVQTLSEKTGMTERGVRKSISHLIKIGRITKTQGGGRGLRNGYLINYQNTLNNIQGLSTSGTPKTLNNIPRYPEQYSGFPIGESENFETPNGNGTVKRGDSNSKKEVTKKSGSTLHSKPPDIEEFVEHGRSRGATDQDCRDQFLIWQDCGWRDGKGNRIISWKGKLTTFVTNHWMPSDKRRANASNSNTPKQKGFCNL